MSRTTIAQLEAVVAAQANDIALAHEAITALGHQLARLEQQVAHLQIANKAQPAPASHSTPWDRMSNQERRVAYAAFRYTTGEAPNSRNVREWVNAGRPGL
jgi:uncharacterized coiled-coil protein SlyX